jgi:hypothetical protein
MKVLAHLSARVSKLGMRRPQSIPIEKPELTNERCNALQCEMKGSIALVASSASQSRADRTPVRWQSCNERLDQYRILPCNQYQQDRIARTSQSWCVLGSKPHMRSARFQRNAIKSTVEAYNMRLTAQRNYTPRVSSRHHILQLLCPNSFHLARGFILALIAV